MQTPVSHEIRTKVYIVEKIEKEFFTREKGKDRIGVATFEDMMM
jgi:hypothetical protein